MKKIVIIIICIFAAITVNAQNIIKELSARKDINRITELCEQYDRLQYKSDIESDASVKAVYSKYALKTLEQIGAIYTDTEIGSNEEINFNIGFDIYTIYNAVVKKIMQGNKNQITEEDYAIVKACEKDIYDNKKLI